MRGKSLKNAVVIILLLLISINPILPLIKHPFNQLPDNYDGLLQVWIINQNIKKIPYDLGNIFEGNIFYPSRSVKAFSEPLVPSSLISHTTMKMYKEPVLSFNLVLLFSQVITALVIYYWWKEVSKSKLGAFVGTLTFVLSQIRFHYIGHLQMWITQWWILSLYFAWKFKIEDKLGFVYLSVFFLAIQVWESLFPVVFVVFSLPIIFYDDFKRLLENWRKFIIPLVLFFILIFPIVRMYLQVSKEYSFTRSIRDAANFSMNMEDLWGKFFSPVLYILLGYVLFVCRKVIFKNKSSGWLLPILVFGVVMALGPVLKWDEFTFKLFGKIFIPLPYGVFYYLLPFFKAFRTPSRWIMLSAWAASGIIAIGLSKLKYKKDWLLVVSIFIALFVFRGRIKHVFQLPKYEEYPMVYDFIASQPNEVIMEYPMYSWGGQANRSEVYRMLYSLKHGKKMVNGYSGFFPASWKSLQEDISVSFPDEKTKIKLRDIGVGLIIVHKDEIKESKLKEIEERVKEVKIYDDVNAAVYRI